MAFLRGESSNQLLELYLVKFHVDPDPNDAPSVICALPRDAFDKTFAGRSVHFRYVEWLHKKSKFLSDGKNVYFPVHVGVQGESITNMAVTGGDPVVADSPFPNIPGEYKSVKLSSGQFASFEWEDQDKRDARDLALVVVGVIPGITGTALFELLKLPFRLEK